MIRFVALRKGWKWALFCVWLLTVESKGAAQPEATPELLYARPEVLTASIYACKTEPPQLLFKFRRMTTSSGSITSVLREFSYPDGKLAACERVEYHGNNLHSYELDELQTGASGRAEIIPNPNEPQRGKISFQYSKTSGNRSRGKPSTELLAPDTLIADMMGTFLSSNYDRIISGQKVTCRYAVVSRKETIGFAFTKESETSWHGQETIRLKMQAISPIIAALIDPYYLTIEKASPHRVLEFVGRTTPKVGESGHWKDLDAVTVFDW
jgi:hypothetical protein